MQHPKGLYLLFVTEMAERFSYYGMRALFVLYLVAAFFNNDDASEIYGSYTGLVYLTPLLGGYIADRYWGNRRSIIAGGLMMSLGQFLMFASACFVNQSIFERGGQIDIAVDNRLSLWLMFAGLAALIVGNGFFKPNISTMVGDLYEPDDHRKDSAFTIFYMGINLGALIAPLICGPLGKGDWSNPDGFKWGFFVAGCAMVLSVLVFVTLKNRYLVTPDGKQIGTTAKQERLVSLDEARQKAEHKGHGVVSTLLCVALGAVLMYVFSYNADDYNDYISAAIYAISIALPVFIITDGGLTKDEKKKICVIYIIALFVIFFWSAFEQAGSSLTIFADKQCDRYIGGWEMPTTWFQSINPIVVVLFAPIMAVFWETIQKHGIQVHSITKQSIGLALLALGYLVIAYGTYGVHSSVKISMWWLCGLYFIHTLGELSLSPIGLSLVTKLSPARMASLLMGVWFMSNAASNILAGKLATLLPIEGEPNDSIFGIEISTLSDFFLLFAIMAGVAALLLFIITPWLKRMIGEEKHNI